MIAGLHLDDWMNALVQALDEMAGSVFGCSIQESGRHENPPAGFAGAYLGLVGPSGGVQVGLASPPPGCQSLSKSLLAMEPGGAELPPAEVADAICEIVNILAGGVKSRVRERLPSLQMGLPTFFHGSVQPTEKLAVSVAEVRIGGVDAAVMLLHQRRGD